MRLAVLLLLFVLLLWNDGHCLPRVEAAWATSEQDRRYYQDFLQQQQQQQPWIDPNANYWGGYNHYENDYRQHDSSWFHSNVWRDMTQNNPRQQQRYRAPTSNNSAPSPRRQSRHSTWITGHARESLDLHPRAPASEIVVQHESIHRPWQAELELFDGSNRGVVAPIRFHVSSAPGHGFCALVPHVSTTTRHPTGRAGSLSIRNTGPLELPLQATVAPTGGTLAVSDYGQTSQTLIQGNGAVQTFPTSSSGQWGVTLDSPVGTAVNATLQVWGATNRVLQTIHLQQQQQDAARPISLILSPNTPFCVLSIQNTGSREYPLIATTAPFWEGRQTSPKYAKAPRQVKYVDLPDPFDAHYVYDWSRRESEAYYYAAPRQDGRFHRRPFYTNSANFYAW